MAGSAVKPTTTPAGFSPDALQKRDTDPYADDVDQELARALRARFALNSPALVAELYASALRELSAETARQMRLDSKAASLLTAAGLSLTVATALFARAGLSIGAAWVAIYLVAVLVGLAAAACAVGALFVREHGAPSANALLAPSLLRDANALDKDDNEGKSPFGLMAYQKAVTPHYWQVVLRQQGVLAKKARLVKAGQACFLAFLLVLFVICARAGWTLVSR